MKKMLLAIAVVATGVLFSCNSGGSGDPKSVLTSFLEALSKNDIEGARKLATTDSKEMLDMMEMGMKSGAKNENTGIADMEFGEPKIDGDKATVSVKDKKKDKTTNFSLKKEDGAWKVAFTKASMMGDNMDKINEGVQEGMDKMKDMNADSLKDKMNEGMEKMKEGADKMKEGVDKMKDKAEEVTAPKTN